MNGLRNGLFEGVSFLPLFEGEAGGFTAPQGMPADLAGKDAAETLGKVWGSHQALSTRVEGMRGELAKMPKPPGKPEEYAYKPSDRLAPFFGDLAQNKIFAQARAAAHKAGISNDQFSGLIEGTYLPLLENNLLAAPFDPKAELASYMKAGNITDEKIGAGELTANEAWINGLYGQLEASLPEGLRETAKAELAALTDTAAGNMVIKSLMAQFNNLGIRVEGAALNQGVLTADDIKKLGSDPRIDPANKDHADASKRYDPALRAKFDDGYKKHFNTPQPGAFGS